ncbi:MAG: hypothetical protein RBR37_02945 [Advenella sp.]|nr:hypothetical protein [Advenella sp.]
MAASLKTINDLVNDEIGQSFTVNPLPALGAEITHIDLSTRVRQLKMQPIDL